MLRSFHLQIHLILVVLLFVNLNVLTLPSADQKLDEDNNWDPAKWFTEEEIKNLGVGNLPRFTQSRASTHLMLGSLIVGGVGVFFFLLAAFLFVIRRWIPKSVSRFL
ncbi:hypothetical protein M3Y98_00540700 [Aphelenchoides besseyi]|nr:hypothetical protein M3Y98_00540700 [Aphelenchoides besseyi]KAI6208132.1 hypothetical protein M3Y96_00082500 [Aphelenchoides besseyi]